MHVGDVLMILSKSAGWYAAGAVCCNITDSFWRGGQISEGNLDVFADKIIYGKSPLLLHGFSQKSSKKVKILMTLKE